MSTYYYFYLDGMYKGERVPLVPKMYNAKQNAYKIKDFFYGISMLRDVYDKILEVGYHIDFDKLPKELYDVIVNSSGESIDSEQLDYLRKTLIAADIDDLRKTLPPNGQKEYHGYVHKDQIVAYEIGECTYLEPVDINKYDKFSEAKKKLYSYYEWDDEYGYIMYMREIIARADILIDLFQDINYDDDLTNIRVICQVL